MDCKGQDGREKTTNRILRLSTQATVVTWKGGLPWIKKGVEKFEILFGDRVERTPRGSGCIWCAHYQDRPGHRGHRSSSRKEGIQRRLIL